VIVGVDTPRYVKVGVVYLKPQFPLSQVNVVLRVESIILDQKKPVAFIVRVA
jgi:hypothetical protein